MSRILILILFLLWLTFDPGQAHGHATLWARVPVFFGFYALLVLVMGIWGRWLARRVVAENFQRSLKRFNFTMEAARIMVPAWFAVGVVWLGWPILVERAIHESLMQTVPGVVLGTLPALLAWVGLWWSQYPADRALREQNVLGLLDAELPLHDPPGFGSYFASNLRLQLLFMGVPVLLIVFGHDLGMLLIRAIGLRPATAQAAELIVWILSAGTVFFFAPEILRRVLRTEPLPDSPLRRRLDTLCRRTGVRYRDVLLWNTDHNMGNAAVMGFVPQLRYILLSDLLLERMPDDEIEAVFAHEVGHIVHRHMAWYVVFIVVLTLINAGPGKWAAAAIAPRIGSETAAQSMVLAGCAIANFLLLFGFVSRRFERQADVYAARTIQMHKGPETLIDSSPAYATVSVIAIEGAPPTGSLVAALSSAGPAALAPRLWEGRSYVGHHGAMIFGSALRRVAVVNNIPLAARSWCHGSIAKRMRYLQDLSANPQLTVQFDRFMLRMNATMLALLFVAATVFALTELT